jgi:DNA-binding XRE family transcriptional regulator
MPNIASALRDEILRLSRRETRNQVDPTKKVGARHRRAIAELKRQVTQLQRQVALLSRKTLGAPAAPNGDASVRQVRYTAKGLRAVRARLRLSADDFGKLLGVSAQSVYNWEKEKARPRPEQLSKLAALRGVGKREAAERLKQLGGGNGKRLPAGRRPVGKTKR